MQKRYKQGHFIGLGMAIGIPLGMPIGLAMGNIALGPVLGVALGIPIGVAMEKKNNPNPILLTAEEKKVKKRNLLIVLSIGVIMLATGVITYFLIQK